VSSKYKQGDYVSEDDLGKALKLPNKEGQTGVSGQDYSTVKMDAKGPYVIKIGDKIEK
jgi:hypothetical protein